MTTHQKILDLGHGYGRVQPTRVIVDPGYRFKVKNAYRATLRLLRTPGQTIELVDAGYVLGRWNFVIPKTPAERAAFQERIDKAALVLEIAVELVQEAPSKFALMQDSTSVFIARTKDAFEGLPGSNSVDLQMLKSLVTSGQEAESLLADKDVIEISSGSPLDPLEKIGAEDAVNPRPPKGTILDAQGDVATQEPVP